MLLADSGARQTAGGGAATAADAGGVLAVAGDFPAEGASCALAHAQSDSAKAADATRHSLLCAV